MSNARNLPTTFTDEREEVDLTKYPTAKALVERASEFFAEVKNMTPGQDLEKYLNENYGPGNPYYEDFCKYVRQGIKNNEGWCATIQIDGARYRRSRVSLPKPATHHFSITTVFMDSQEVYRGEYHSHPYGEINCVIQIDEGAELKGMKGWQGAGWTSPGAGTHHYPEVRKGAVVALYFLLAGRISFAANESMPQPLIV
ncbi:unnamed protein product [Clonostachys solani]|uniref:p-hydroxylaminobenzoate lyase n=1 Tax=Clonostachys solani TaxID=160281 RepID=A0A9P0EQC7_9HYPO|nr:unnamed protein product [Clonostachys solani]